MDTFKQKYWKYSLIGIILILTLVLLKEVMPYLGGLLGAITIYILVRNQMIRLTTVKKMKRGKAAALITVEIIFGCLIPLAGFIWLVASQVGKLNIDPSSMVHLVDEAEDFIKMKTGFDIFGSNSVSYIADAIPKIAQAIMGAISSFIIDLFVIIFILYFMLIGGTKMEQYIKDILPFNDANTDHVCHEVELIVRSNAIGIPVIAIIQGTIASVGYLIFGVHDVLMVGLLTCFATVIPVVGTALIWIPVAIILAIKGHWLGAVGIMAYGVLVVAQSDNLTRFILQKKMADIHPLITVFGVIIGISMFGFMGVIFGPLILSLFGLFINMFKQEYLDAPPNKSDTMESNQEE